MQPLAAMTWEEARDVAGPGSVALLPVGAIEAHGPHLPLETDVIIARAMARDSSWRRSAAIHRAIYEELAASRLSKSRMRAQSA